MHGRSGMSGEPGFLAAIAHMTRQPLDGRHVAIVVAHPDDETLGCGALLARLKGVRVVVVTDGAPRNLADAGRYGFPDARAYAQARKAELLAALAMAGVPPQAVTWLGIPDQEACRNMPAVTRALTEFFAAHGISTVLTHAFEGGHPDHDATAFSVHAAARLRDRDALEIIEMPFYHLGKGGMSRQEFCDGDENCVLFLDAAERDCKARMVACHATQHETLRPFSLEFERFRQAGAYHFASLPNGGRVLYAQYDWGLSPPDWPGLVREARDALAMEAAAWA
ncbi:PIG-L deacetylase family protein [Chelatococcus sp. GCM10030263]|uniref:PIG-L deacetylase family protein n=1 Tax=Chelatococcus sp. GCM10030263 TaxID=3273387 RepID=UPI003621799A